MRRKIFSFVVFICLIILGFQLGKQFLPELFGIVPKGGLKILASPNATVYLNGVEAGKTPFSEDNLNIGEYLVKLIAVDSSWQGKILLNKGTLSVINRNLAPNIASSSGESLILDSGEGVTITSSPDESNIAVDGKLIGKTPLFISNLSPGAHFFTLSHDNYSSRRVDVILPKNLSLHINVDLSLVGINEGKIITPTVALVQKVVIKQTPLGYLRLRESPNINSKEVAQVSAGEELVVLSEAPGWVKVRLNNNLEGWVSVQYVQKFP